MAKQDKPAPEDAYAAAGAGKKFDAVQAHQQITEAQLFIDAVHHCHNRIRSAAPAGKS